MDSQGAKKTTRRIPRIGIVGGGPGGLFTALLLEQGVDRPINLTILEASSRLGGKVLTPRFKSNPVRYEAGAAEFYDYSTLGEDSLKAMVRSMGLHLVGLSGSGVHFAGRLITNLDDLEQQLGKGSRNQMAHFDTWARSAMTPNDFFMAGTDQGVHSAPAIRFDKSIPNPISPDLGRYIETMIHSDLATHASTTTTTYGLQNYLMNDPAYMRLYRIFGGNEQLIECLAARISARVLLSTRVLEVGTGIAGRIQLVLGCANGREQEEFDAIVLALPMDALKQLTFRGNHLAEAMEKHVRHHDHPAHYLRVTVLTDIPCCLNFGDDGYLMLDAFDGCCLYLEVGREAGADHSVLGWLIGGQSAEQMSLLDDEELVTAVLPTLPDQLSQVKDRVIESRVHRWVGAVSAVPGGWSPLSEAMRHRPAAKTHPNLLVVGDYLYDSTLNGALESAEHVVGWLTAHLDTL